ncbi:MAG: CCA tRNA nucleotidyltransferase, partial [Candidatus Omnitrophica bacterium]|nr:CCA tRNA nucleotidyltransferase [Candidatus Omnitrophota bacterium]
MELGQGKGRIAYGIVKRLAEAGYVAYFAGGCVRDDLMHECPGDYDIATSASPDDVEKLFPKTIAVGKQFGVIIVVEGDAQFEVATFRREGSYRDGRHPSEVSFTDPEEDAKRRDFTVNGLFYDPIQNKVIDYVGGQKDLQAKIIRAIGAPDERFEEDKLRLLRAVRFASVLGFEIEPATWSAVCRRFQEIHDVSPERIRDEIVKMLTRPGADRGLDLLSRSCLLKEILPEIEAMKNIQQPPAFHPEGDVFVHTKLMLAQLKNPSKELALAVLFHDVGKPPTLAVRDGHITFYEHAPLGARMTETIMRRLRFSNDEIETVAGCVENHMRFGDVQKMREGK